MANSRAPDRAPPEAHPPGVSAPLAAHPVFRVRGADALASELARNYGADLRAVAPRDEDLSAANRAQVGGVHLHYCHYKPEVEIAFSSMAGLRQMICLGGAGVFVRGGRRLSLAAGSTGLLPPDSDFEARYGAGYQQLVLQFDETALRRQAEAITGAPLPAELGATFMEDWSQSSRVRSIAIAQALGQVLTLEGAALGVTALELANALATAFLIENAPVFAERLAARQSEASPAKTRLFEDYIQQHWNQAISVEDVAAACGVSVRSVFAQFRRHRGVSPLVYQRNLRLDHARRMLLSSHNTLSVIEVAMACGFASFGHFARRYRDRFGELPSATRVRGELGAGPAGL
jgi:AraC-like DNA-binding protein